MFEKLLKPQVNLAALFLRLGLAAIFTVHGYFKVVQHASFFTELPLAVHMLVGWTELICGLALAVGLFSRIDALAIIVIQLGAIFLRTGEHALRIPAMGPRGADFTRVGPEYNLVLILMCMSLIVLGSGKFSLDHFLVQWWRGRKDRDRSVAIGQGEGGAHRQPV